MAIGGGLRVLCPRCQYFVLCIWLEGKADLEVNCPADKCLTTLRIAIQNGRIAIEATPKLKKA